LKSKVLELSIIQTNDLLSREEITIECFRKSRRALGYCPNEQDRIENYWIAEVNQNSPWTFPNIIRNNLVFMKSLDDPPERIDFDWSPTIQNALITFQKIMMIQKQEQKMKEEERKTQA
jgi:hypothetical protein